MAELYDSLTGSVKIAMVGKYTGLTDSYLSVVKALLHACVACSLRPSIKWIAASDLEDESARMTPGVHNAAWESLKVRIFQCSLFFIIQYHSISYDTGEVISPDGLKKSLLQWACYFDTSLSFSEEFHIMKHLKVKAFRTHHVIPSQVTYTVTSPEIAFTVDPMLVTEVDAVVYLLDAFAKERFAELKKELDALLSDDSFSNVLFLILGNKIDIPYAASKEELRYHLGLSNFTTGKGKVNLVDSNVCPLEVFMCSIVRKMGYGDGGFKWVS